MSHADQLRATVGRLVREAIPLRQATVATVGVTTVDLNWGLGVIEDVPCASSYATRRPGDKVWVIRSASGSWEVIARSDSPDPSPPA